MKYLLLFSFCLSALFLLSQKPQGGALGSARIGRVYGKIVDDAAKQAVPYASVTVLRVLPNGGGDTLVGGALSLDNGDFSVGQLPMGMLKVRVRYVGYKEWTKMVKISAPNDLELDLGDLVLQ
ncbi:MAG: carboxypeptidase-like regulatory domain-containing protein, partial [Saprospiraceae bacterium]